MTIKHVISMSGGKDSQATIHYAQESVDPVVPWEDVILLAADTGNEHQLTYDHWDYIEQHFQKPLKRLRRSFDREIAGKREYVLNKWPEKGVPPDVVERAAKILTPTGNPYLDLCIWKGRFPSRKAQFCTQFLKTEPMVEYQMELLDAGFAVWSWQGVRRNESQSRRYAKEFEEVGGGLYIFRPLVRWKASDTFDAMAACGSKPNPLYTLGMTRVGCMPCINAQKEEIREIAARFPEVVDRIEEWESIVCMAGKGQRGDISSFFPNPDREAHLDKRGIRKMVEWSKTSRGGRQFDMMKAVEMDGDAGKCTSSYGLCE